MKVQSDRSEQIARRAQTLDHRWPVNFQHLLDWKLPVCYGQSPSKIIVIVLFKWGWLPLLSNYQRWFRWVRSFPWAHRPRDKRQQVWQRPRLLASLLFPSLALAAKHVADRSSVDPSDWGISLQPYGYNQLASKITDWIQNLATTVVSCDVKILSMIAPVCVAKTTPSETMSATSTQACCLQSWKRESSFQRNTWFCWEMEVPKMEDPKKNIRIIGRYFDGFPKCFGVTQFSEAPKQYETMVLQGCLHLGFPFFHALQMNLMQARLCRKPPGNWSIHHLMETKAICLGVGYSSGIPMTWSLGFLNWN